MPVVDCVCEGNPQQAFSVVAQGSAGPFNFEWSGPNGYTSFVMMPTNIEIGGVYTLMVTNTYECTFTYDIEIPACPPLNFFPEAITPAACPEAANGIVALSAEGGAPPYIVIWSDGATGLYRRCRYQPGGE